MFEQTLEAFGKITDTTIRMQQEAFSKWLSLWPGLQVSEPVLSEQVHKAQKQWSDFVKELVKKQRTVFETQFNAGLKAIEDSYKLTEVKSPEELRTVTIELWKKSFDCLREAFAAQTNTLQAAAGKWTELVTAGAV